MTLRQILVGTAIGAGSYLITRDIWMTVFALVICLGVDIALMARKARRIEQ